MTPWTAAQQASLSITISWSLLTLTSFELVMPSNHLILYRPLLLPSIFPSIRVFSNDLHIRWAKVLEFQLQHQLDCCIWGGLSVFWQLVVLFYCGDSSLCVGLYEWLVKVSCLGKPASLFWWVELDFSPECNEVSSSEF